MRVFFDDSFGGGAWPGPFGAKATAGELWVGRAGLVGALEGQLGLAHEPVGASARLGEVVQALQRTRGFWSESFDADALATAQELTRIHDALRLAGWDRKAGGPRLAALGRAFESVSEGLAERLERLTVALARCPDVRPEVHLFAPLDGLPMRLRQLVSALGPPRLAAPPPDVLEQLPRALQLIRPYGPLVAADAVAQALAATRSTPTLIVGGDAVLDAALRRHGLPTTGAASEPQDNALGELLPLVVELGLSPADPARAMELLTLPASPIRPAVARRLVRALQQWPAVGSPAWHEQLAHATESFSPEEKAAVSARLADFLQADVQAAQGYPVSRLHARAASLLQWLQGKAAYEKSEDAQRHLLAAVAQVSAFSELVTMTGATTLSTAQVRRFLEASRAAMPTPAAWPAEAGLFAVDGPGSVVGPAPRIVWWNFTRDAFSAPRRLPLLREEEEALAASGVHVPHPSTEALRQMQRERRPLQHGVGSELWLIAPLHDAAGEEATPHPLWDEVVGAWRDEAQALVHAAPVVKTPPRAVQREPLARLGPVREWKTKVPIERRDVESPSSIEHFLGCTLAWALRYVAGLREGTTATIDAGHRMFGSLAHHVLLERTLKTTHDSPEAAGQHAEQVFLTEGPTLAAPLFQEGADADRITVKEAIRRAAEALWLHVSAGWKVLETEAAHRSRAFGTTFEGKVDLVLQQQRRYAVIDLKWSGQPSKRQLLEKGAAIQLHAYAALLEDAGFPRPAVAYFIIQSQAWLSASEHLVTEDTRIEAPKVDTWELTKQAHAAAWKQVKRGELTAPGVSDDAPARTQVEDGALQVSPPCGYCEFQGICGRKYGLLEASDGEG